MGRISVFLMTMMLFLGLAISTHATLIDLGGGMIYSTDLDITWLQDANYAQTSNYDADGLMTWDEAMAWVNSLSYGGYDNWRLPTFDPENPDARVNPTLLHEMGYLSYAELGNPGMGSNDLQNTGPFINLMPDENNWIEPWYWSGTEGPLTPEGEATAWRFDFECG